MFNHGANKEVERGRGGEGVLDPPYYPDNRELN